MAKALKIAKAKVAPDAEPWVKFTMRLPSSVIAEIERRAGKENRATSEVIRDLLEAGGLKIPPQRKRGRPLPAGK